MLERYFQLSAHGTTARTEVVAGLTTFLTMAYIIFVNPDILSAAGMPRDSVFVATCLAAALGSLIMGLYANYPIALAPGMGLNAYFAFTVVQGMGFTWQAAENEHSQRSLAIRIDHGPKSLFYSGDGRPTRDTLALARHCQVIVHEAFHLGGATPGDQTHRVHLFPQDAQFLLCWLGRCRQWVGEEHFEARVINNILFCDARVQAFDHHPFR